MTLEQLKSAIYNDIVSGLRGITSNPSISLEQLEDDIIDERLIILKEYGIKNMLPKRDLLMAINCIDVDCKSMDKCPCGNSVTKPR
jgi:transaldolase